MVLRYCCLLLLALCSLTAVAQREWADFVDTYLTQQVEDEEAVTALLEEWEELHRSPYNINTITREQLLKLPYIDEPTADSILVYRERRREFTDLAELLFIRRLGYEARSFLPLFLTCEPLPKSPPSVKEWLWGGKKTLETVVDLPFYQRKGYTSEVPFEQRYLGAAWRHALRLQYQYKDRFSYGLTLEKDAGEPFAAQVKTPRGVRSNLPYDYFSFHLYYRDVKKRLQGWAGDYRVRVGEGLLLGTTMYGTKIGRWNARPMTDIRPYRSTGETGFYRGLAFRYFFSMRRESGRLSLLTFASYRAIDAKVSGDTLQTIYTSGLHRTVNELQYRREAAVMTAGANVSYDAPFFHIGATTYYAHYSHVVNPSLRDYNRYYLRGKSAAGVSVDAHLRFGKHWKWSGEIALDGRAHGALLHRLHYASDNSSDALHLFLQHRSISSRFVAPFAFAPMQNSRVANEQGVCLGVRFAPFRHCSFSSFMDFAYFPEARFRSLPRAIAFEWYAEMQWQEQKNRRWLFSYRGKAKQEKLRGIALMEYRTTHRLVAQSFWQLSRLSLVPSLRTTLYHSQTASPLWGAMAALRLTYLPTERWKVGLFGGVFFSEDHETRQYAYEPQLVGVAAFPSYHESGVRWVGQVQYQLSNSLFCALRWGMTALFDGKTMGSGSQAMTSSWKNDMGVQLRWRF